jgi:hypothetical protein
MHGNVLDGGGGEEMERVGEWARLKLPRWGSWLGVWEIKVGYALGG